MVLAVAERKAQGCSQTERHQLLLLAAGVGCSVAVGVHGRIVRCGVETQLFAVEGVAVADVEHVVAPAAVLRVGAGEPGHEPADAIELPRQDRAVTRLRRRRVADHRVDDLAELSRLVSRVV